MTLRGLIDRLLSDALRKLDNKEDGKLVIPPEFRKKSTTIRIIATPATITTLAVTAAPKRRAAAPKSKGIVGKLKTIMEARHSTPRAPRTKKTMPPLLIKEAGAAVEEDPEAEEPKEQTALYLMTSTNIAAFNTALVEGQKRAVAIFALLAEESTKLASEIKKWMAGLDFKVNTLPVNETLYFPAVLRFYERAKTLITKQYNLESACILSALESDRMRQNMESVAKTHTPFFLSDINLFNDTALEAAAEIPKSSRDLIALEGLDEIIARTPATHELLVEVLETAFIPCRFPRITTRDPEVAQTQMNERKIEVLKVLSLIEKGRGKMERVKTIFTKSEVIMPYTHRVIMVN